MSSKRLRERLHGAGLRATAARVAVLEVLTSSGDHPRIDEIIRRVRARDVTISTQAAYDVCEALHRVGLARRIDLAGGPVRYEGRVGDNHHHLVCRRCGLTIDVDCATGSPPCQEPADAHGFALEEAEVTYWGVCPACRTGDGAGADARATHAPAATRLPPAATRAPPAFGALLEGPSHPVATGSADSDRSPLNTTN